MRSRFERSHKIRFDFNEPTISKPIINASSKERCELHCCLNAHSAWAPKWIGVIWMNAAWKARRGHFAMVAFQQFMPNLNENVWIVIVINSILVAVAVAVISVMSLNQHCRNIILLNECLGIIWNDKDANNPQQTALCLLALIHRNAVHFLCIDTNATFHLKPTRWRRARHNRCEQFGFDSLLAQ